MMFKVMDWGSIVEWGLAFFIMFYFLSLFWDFKNMDIMLIRRKWLSLLYDAIG